MYTLEELYSQPYMQMNNTLYVNAKELSKWIDVALFSQLGQLGTPCACDSMVRKEDVLKLIEFMAEDNILSEAKMQEIRNRNIKRLQKEAYKLCIEQHDFSRVDKVIAGIKEGRITKDNLFDEIRKLTKGIRSDHSIRRWETITDWFFEKDWA